MLAVNYRECRVLGRAFEGVAWRGSFFYFFMNEAARAPPPAVGTHPSPPSPGFFPKRSRLGGRESPGARGRPFWEALGTRASVPGAVPARPALQIAGFDSKTPDFRAGRAQLAPQ